MRQMGKRMISAALCLLMLVSMTAGLGLTVAADETDIVRIEVPDITVQLGVDDQIIYGWEGEYRGFYSLVNRYTVCYENGGSDSYEYYDYVSGYGYLTVETSQGPGTEWGVGTYTATAKLGTLSTTFTVTVQASPIARLEFKENITLYEGESCHTATQYVDDCLMEYRRYGYDLPSCTVWLTDGSSVECPYGYFEWQERCFYLQISDDQGYGKEWGVGDHTATVTLMGVTGTYTVTIAESPIALLEVEPVKLIEHVSGDWVTYWNDQSEKPEEYFSYSIPVPHFTITLKTGEVITDDDPWIINGKDYSVGIRSAQSNETPFTRGNNTATLSVCGTEQDFTVQVIESPVSSLVVEPIHLYEGEDLWPTESYDYETGEWLKYNAYSYRDKICGTLNFNDGTPSCTLDAYSTVTYGRYDYYLEITDDQGYGQEWGVGTHTANLTLMGTTVPVTVVIEASPIKAITVDPITIIEGTSTQEEWDWFDDPPKVYTKYYYWVGKYSVTLNSGEVLTSDRDGIIRLNGTDYRIWHTDDQSATVTWGVGRHPITVEVAGFKDTAYVDVVSSPIRAIHLNEVEMIYGTDQGDASYYDEKTGESRIYRYYNYYPYLDGTVEFIDGTVAFIRRSGLVQYQGRTYEIRFQDDQAYDHVWGVGPHTVTASLMGESAAFTVTVKESPLVSLAVEPIDLPEGSTQIRTDEVTWEQYEAYVYDSQLYVTATFHNGQVITGFGGIPYDGRWYTVGITDDQTAAKPWERGTHSATVSLMGVETQAVIRVIESPVERVEFDPTVLYYGLDTREYTDYSGDEPVAYTYWDYNWCLSGTVYFKDGSSTRLQDGWVSYGNQSYDVTCSDDQSVQTPWELGEHTVTVNVLGKEFPATVTAAEVPVAKLTVNDCVSYVGLDTRWGAQQYDPEFAVTLRDGTVLNAITNEYGDRSVLYNGRSFDLWIEDDQDGTPWGIGAHTAFASLLGMSDTFTVEVKENPIEQLEIKPLTLMENISGTQYIEDHGEGLKPYFYYDLTPEFTVVLKDGTRIESQFGSAEVMGRTQYIYANRNQDANPLPYGESNVEFSVFGVEAIGKVTLKPCNVESVTIEDTNGFAVVFHYSDKTSETVPVRQLHGDCWTMENGGREFYGDIRTDKGNFTVDITSADSAFTETVMMTIGAFSTNVLTKTDAIRRLLNGTVAYGDATNDGNIDSKDVVRLRKYLAAYDFETGTSTVDIGAGADATGDGNVDSKDVVRLRKYLAAYDFETGTSTVTLGPDK